MDLRGDALTSAVAAALLSAPVVAARAATWSGVVAGFAHAWWFSFQGGVAVTASFIALVVLGVGATRLGHARKTALGVAQEGRGRRAARHVIANAGPAAGCLVLGALNPEWRAVASIAACGALAGSLADTVAGELGMLSRATPRLLLFGPAVPRGRDGGMTIGGLLASAGASAAVAGVVAASGGVTAVGPVFAAGMTGSVVDSVLGATAERAGWLRNEGVNFCASAAAGLAAALLAGGAGS